MKYLFLLLICVYCCLFGYARPVIVYDDDNLSCNRIISLEQDAYGFIWIATEDGLNKFDGYTFANYFHDESDSCRGSTCNSDFTCFLCSCSSGPAASGQAADRGA